MRKGIFLFTSCFCLLFASCKEADPDIDPIDQESNAIEINRQLGRGMNMGNAFDAPSETEWGNPWKPEYFRIMADLGFKHVRVPIRWEPEDRSMSDAPYTVSQTFLDRIKTVVDEALNNNLYVIINMHHHEALMSDPTGQHARFLAQWEQISAYFSSYSDKLLFEILNEPTNKLTAPIWNLYMSEALKIIRKTNPDRTVLIGAAEGGVINALKYLVLPEDRNLILTIHYYNPFEFTHQGAEWAGNMEQYIGTKWYDSEEEREIIRQEFEVLKAFSQKHYNIPVHIGEFGSIGTADLDSRVRWTTFLTRWFEEQGFSWAFWEFSAGFGIYDPETKTFLEPLVDALLHNPMPEPGIKPDDPGPGTDPEPEPGEIVYASNFETDNDGWTLNQNDGAVAATLSRENNALVANITSSGSEGWHLQVARTGISLQKNKQYRCTLSVSASADCAFDFYLDDNGPTYQAFNPERFSVGSTKTEFHSTFTVSEDDNDARIAFNLGGIPVTQFTLYSFKLEIIDPDPDPEPGEIVYASNFTTGTDGWTLNKNNEVVDGTLSLENNALVADITSNGSDGWHLQVAKTDIPLLKNKQYRCTLSVSSSVNSIFEWYLDDNGPTYQAFNPGGNLSVENTKIEFSSIFTMTSEDDSDARIVFNLGKAPVTKFTLYSFKIEIIESE